MDVDPASTFGPMADSAIVFLDGHLAKDGQAHARFDMTNFDIGNLASLLESSVPVRGLVSVDATVDGTAAEPKIQGRLALRA